MLSTVFQYTTRQYHSLWLSAFILGAALFFYIVHQRYFHPLSKFPGPYIASVTNWCKSHHVYKLDLHEAVLALHRTFGPVVRNGPNDLHF
jgi:purine-cytosine permease-like protein